MTNPVSYTSLANIAANGQSAAIDLGNSTVSEVTVYLGTGATFGSGTLILQQSFDGGTTYFTVPNFSKTSGTANQVLGKVHVIGGGKIRASLSGATGPSLDVRIKVEQVASPVVSQVSFAANGTSTFYFNPKAFAPVTTAYEAEAVLCWAYQGTWGSGTLTLEVSPDSGTTWFKQAAGVTANGISYTQGVTDQLCRFQLAGATSPALTVFFVAS